MWQPEEASLKALVDLLNESQVPDDVKQKEVHRKINELTKQQEFCNYLVYIISITDNPSLDTLRKIAGATLKGVLERNWDKILPQNLEFVKLKLMEAFRDSTSKPIRSSIANSLTVLFVKLGFAKWPELIKFIAMNLSIDNVDLVESTLECIAKILEDMVMDSENIDYFEEKTNSPLGELIPKLISMCDPRYSWNIRALALRSLNLFTSFMPPSFLANMHDYFQVLFICAEDQQALVRQRSCEGFLGIFETRKDLITENLQKILERMLQFTVDPNSDVKKKACLFWNEYLLVRGDEPLDRIEALHQYLEFLLPALIDCLPYTEEDLLTLDSQASESNKKSTYYPTDDDDEEEGIREIHDASENVAQGEYTLRKEAGLAIEAIARRFENEAFYKCQTKIAKCLEDNNWLVRESGILCLGSLGKGASDAIVEHFQSLFPFLMESLHNNEPLLRCIALWTLSRYTEWIVNQGNTDENVVKVYLTESLKLMTDTNDKVQEAGCTALSKIAYEGTRYVEHYISDVIQVVKFAAEKYKKESTKYLYDSIGSLAYNISKEILQNSNVEDALMGIIVNKWETSQFNDVEATCLIECTESLISAIEEHAGKYAEFFITRLSFLIYNYLQAVKEDDKKYLFHKKEIAIRCFDLFDSYLGLLGAETERFLSVNDYQNLFQQCVQDQDIGFKQIVLSSLKIASKKCPNYLKDHLPVVAEILLQNLYFAPQEIDSQGLYMGLCNNAASTLGDVAMAFPESFQSCIPAFAEKLCGFLGKKMHKGLAQAITIALGRLGLVSPDAVAPYLSVFVKPFCMVVEDIEEDPEKQDAYRGLFTMIHKNPTGIVKDFSFLCIALANWKQVPQDLHELAKKILHEFKAFAGNDWPVYFSKFQMHLRETLHQKYDI